VDAISIDSNGFSNTDIQELKDKVSELQGIATQQTVVIDNYRSIVDGMNVKIEQFNETFSTIEKESINPLVQKIDVISEDISKLNALTNDNKRKIYKFSKKGPGRPPFNLLSIDLWGSKASAVLELNGKESIASIGDVRAGWKISQIIKSQSCIKAVRMKDRKVAKLCQAGNA